MTHYACGYRQVKLFLVADERRSMTELLCFAGGLRSWPGGFGAAELSSQSRFTLQLMCTDVMESAQVIHTGSARAYGSVLSAKTCPGVCRVPVCAIKAAVCILTRHTRAGMGTGSADARATSSILALMAGAAHCIGSSAATSRREVTVSVRRTNPATGLKFRKMYQ